MGGPLALLSASPEADVVILGHTGLESVRSLGDLTSGALIGRRVRVRCLRIRATDVPRQSKEAGDWLYERWRELDEWLASTAAEA
jgi:hypothetical protein